VGGAFATALVTIGVVLATVLVGVDEAESDRLGSLGAAAGAALPVRSTGVATVGAPSAPAAPTVWMCGRFMVRAT
jgi:hypothetical protein